MSLEDFKNQLLMRPNRPGWALGAAFVNAPQSMEWQPKPTLAGNLTLTASCYGSNFYPWEVGDRLDMGYWSITGDPLGSVYQYARQAFTLNPAAMTAEAAYESAGLAEFPNINDTKLAPKMWADPLAATCHVMDSLHYFQPSGNLANTEPTVRTTFALGEGNTIPADAIAPAYSSLCESIADVNATWNSPGYGSYNEWEFYMGGDIVGDAFTGVASLKLARQWQTICPTIITAALYRPGSGSATDWDGGTGLTTTPVQGQTTTCSTVDGTAYGVTSPGGGVFWETAPSMPPLPSTTPYYGISGWTGVNLSTYTADISSVIPRYRAALLEEYLAP